MKVVIVLFLWMVGGCSILDSRTFKEQMNDNTDGFFIPGKRFPMAVGDKGKAYRSAADIKRRTPLSRSERKNMVWQRSLEDELYKKERALGPKEYQDYRESLLYLNHISEKIYYLNLSARERGKYIESKRFKEHKHREKSSGISLLKMREFGRDEIRPGMDKKTVLKKWGRPVRVDIAGDPARQNERWSFYYGGQWRQIYFEGGLVQGWRISDE